jgi:hypothetical protein
MAKYNLHFFPLSSSERADNPKPWAEKVGGGGGRRRSLKAEHNTVGETSSTNYTYQASSCYEPSEDGTHTLCSRLLGYLSPHIVVCGKLYQSQSSSERISSRVGQTHTFSVPQVQRLTKPPSVRSVLPPPPHPIT